MYFLFHIIFNIFLILCQTHHRKNFFKENISIKLGKIPISALQSVANKTNPPAYMAKNKDLATAARMVDKVQA